MPVINTIQVRRDTAANWTSTDPTLAAGEIGFETDSNKFKFGNGTDDWTELPYIEGTAITPSTTAPEDTSAIWYNTENGNAYIYYDSFWTSISGLPSIPDGGTTGQLLAKSSSTDYATQWVAPSALTLLNTTTFTAQTTVTVNNVFSADYDDYLIQIDGVQNTSTGTIGATFVNGETPTASEFGYNYLGLRGAAIGDNGSAAANNAAQAFFHTSAATHQFLFRANISNVFLAQRTLYEATAYSRFTGGADSNNSSRWFQGQLSNTTSFEGFRIATNAGTFTGSLRIYGLRKS
jgi:hypothetical protein